MTDRSSLEPFGETVLPMQPVDQIAARIFLADLESQSRHRRIRRADAAQDLASQERWLFWAMLGTAILAPLMVVAGFVLLVTTSLLAVGTLSAVLGLLPGAGSIGLRRMQRAVSRERKALDSAARDDDRFANAVGVIALIPNDQIRARELAKLSTAMMDSIQKPYSDGTKSIEQ